MTDDNKRELFRMVLAAMGTKRGGRKRVFDAIADAHLGRPDGYVVTNDNMSLFRQYRNAVSPRPDHLINAALLYKKELRDDERMIDHGEAMEEQRTGWGVM